MISRFGSSSTNHRSWLSSCILRRFYWIHLQSRARKQDLLVWRKIWRKIWRQFQRKDSRRRNWIRYIRYFPIFLKMMVVYWINLLEKNYLIGWYEYFWEVMRFDEHISLLAILLMKNGWIGKFWLFLERKGVDSWRLFLFALLLYICIVIKENIRIAKVNCQSIVK